MMQEALWLKTSDAPLWTRCMQSLRHRVPESALNTWFSALELLRCDISESGGEAEVGVPNSFVLEYVEHHYLPLIESAFETALGHRVKVVLRVARAPQLEVLRHSTPAQPVQRALGSEPTHLSHSNEKAWRREKPQIDVTIPLNLRNTFDSFVVGDCNQLAHAACMAVAEAPSATNFNPLILYGGTGMGKTHLLQAIAHFCTENETARKIVYRTSEEFTREYIEFVQKNKDSRTFYQVYRDADVLLIDDIQFLAGKEKTQDEFHNIFSVLQSLNKQIVITSDRPPNEIQGLHTRLLSRFDTGLLADLQPPNLETRLAILKKKSESDPQSCVNEDVLSYVAGHVTSSIRELEGTLIKLSAYASFTHLPITVDIAKQILGDTLRNAHRPVTIRRVIELVAQEFQLPVTLLTSQTRKKNVAEPRQIAMYLARQLTDNSLHTIGLAFGRDYSTVIHSVKKVEHSLDREPTLKSQVDRLMAQLG
jgi:chromosomal replication initiator protein